MTEEEKQLIAIAQYGSDEDAEKAITKLREEFFLEMCKNITNNKIK